LLLNLSISRGKKYGNHVYGWFYCFTTSYSYLFGLSVVLEVPSSYMGMSSNIEIQPGMC